MEALSDITSVCTANDLKMLVRLIKGDLRIQVKFQAKVKCPNCDPQILPKNWLERPRDFHRMR